MKKYVSIILESPISVFFFLLIAFMFATISASAAGIPENYQGQGGSPFVDNETVQGTQNELDSQQSQVGYNNPSTILGIVISINGSEITLQTFSGKRTFTLLDESILKEDRVLTSNNSIHIGDIAKIQSDSSGRILNIDLKSGIFGNMGGILLALALSAVVGIIILQLHKRRHAYTVHEHMPKQYFLQ